MIHFLCPDIGFVPLTGSQQTPTDLGTLQLPKQNSEKSGKTTINNPLLENTDDLRKQDPDLLFAPESLKKK